MTNCNEGRVLLGTLCVDAHRTIACIMSVLEDECGDDVQLGIYNAPSSLWKTQDLRRLYPRGSKVAVKEPYFKRADDGLPMVYVDSPENIEILSLPESDAESVLAADLVELRGEGNKCFRDQDWKGAIESYSTCIDLALLRQKIGPQFPPPSHIHNEMKDALLLCYSNRAEAQLKGREFAQAIEDCDKALKLVADHVESLCRKGRVLQALGEYKLASQCFKTAVQQSSTDSDIKSLYEKSKTLNEQNQQGMFNLSTYFINNFRSQDVPEVSNYIGPVMIQKSAGRGRGLFVGDNVDIGDILLVENALAYSYTGTTRTKGLTPGFENLAAELTSSAISFPRIMQQLEYLVEDTGEVPAMDLFRINNGSFNKYDVCNKGPSVEDFDQDIIPKIIQKLVWYLPASMPDPSGISHKTEVYGLWTLPSFINHSCFPNANSLFVGKAIFIIATRKISVGDEITVSYFDSLKPLEMRERVCSERGFRCDCKRCVLERSLPPPLASIFKKISLSLRNSPIKSIANPHSEYSESVMIKHAMKLENAMAALTSEEKQLLRASVFGLYHRLFLIRRVHHSENLGANLPSMMEIADAMQNAVPGQVESFDLIVSFLAEEKGKDGLVFRKSLEVCINRIGKQEERVLKSVLRFAARKIAPKLIQENLY